MRSVARRLRPHPRRIETRVAANSTASAAPPTENRMCLPKCCRPRCLQLRMPPAEDARKRTSFALALARSNSSGS